VDFPALGSPTMPTRSILLLYRTGASFICLADSSDRRYRMLPAVLWARYAWPRTARGGV
jgi:hypothetical protein